MKRADIVLGLAVLLVSAVWLGARLLAHRDGVYVTVEAEGRLYGTYPLSEDQEIDIEGENHISISDGAVRMVSADCPDQICVRQGRISDAGAMITCLPNRVNVRILGDTPGDAPDAVAY